MTLPHFLTLSLGGQDLRLEYDYSPGTPDVHYLPNGDPGYPGDPEELTVTKVELAVAGSVQTGLGDSWLDITELLSELGCDPAIEDAAFAAFLALPEDRFEAPEEDSHAHD